jgi:iron(III) transport system permease protein
MVDLIAQESAGRARLDPWSLAAVLIAALVLLPVASVLWIALSGGGGDIWPHLLSTTLPRYVTNTLVLMAGVGVLTAVVGTGAAWLVTMYRFPGRGWLQWALLLPLAVPAYVGAYALVDFLEYAGPVQTGLRALFGWESARDYRFPEVRTRGAAILVLSGALYPYVYLSAGGLPRAVGRGVRGRARSGRRPLGAVLARGPAARAPSHRGRSRRGDDGDRQRLRRRGTTLPSRR